MRRSRWSRRALWLIGGALVATLLIAGAAQHLRYLSLRRTHAQDRQPILHDSDVFHAVTFVRLREGDELVPALKQLRAAAANSTWIYAGKVVVNVPSTQIGPVEWSGVILEQFSSRAAHDEARANPAEQAALSRFAATYEHGLRRDALENLLLPQALLLRRVIRAARLTASPYPFTATPADQLSPRAIEVLSQLRSAGDLGRKAAIVVNLQRRGTPEQEAHDALYTDAMVGLMAERGYGPLHLGDAVALEHNHAFDRVAIVQYPSTDDFADMLASTFYQTILAHKQLGDNQSTITVPVLDLVESLRP